MSGSLLTSVLASLLSVSVIAALIQASVTMRGWSVTRRREQEQLERTQEQLERDAELRHLQRQMEELYGPLLGLVRQRQAVWEVVKKLVPVTEGGGPDMGHFEDQHWDRWNVLAEDYLIPIQSEISSLLWGKIYLLRSSMLPESFNDFIANTSQFECLYRVAAKSKRTSSDVPGKPWPEEFEGEVAHTLDELKKEYDKRLHRQVPPAVNAHAASARGLPP